MALNPQNLIIFCICKIMILWPGMKGSFKAAFRMLEHVLFTHVTGWIWIWVKCESVCRELWHSHFIHGHGRAFLYQSRLLALVRPFTKHTHTQKEVLFKLVLVGVINETSVILNPCHHQMALVVIGFWDNSITIFPWYLCLPGWVIVSSSYCFSESNKPIISWWLFLSDFSLYFS